MSSERTQSPYTSATKLGVSGYTFADLHDPARLASLHDRFCEHVHAEDPAFWREWDAYRQDPGASRSPVALSQLLVTMASHVSRFVRRLFDVDRPAAAIVESTREQDDLFRFKVDCVRRRALPLLKGGAPIPRSMADDARVERLITAQGFADRELAVARAGNALLDAERSTTNSPQPVTREQQPATSD